MVLDSWKNSVESIEFRYNVSPKHTASASINKGIRVVPLLQWMNQHWLITINHSLTSFHSSYCTFIGFDKCIQHHSIIQRSFKQDIFVFLSSQAKNWTIFRCSFQTFRDTSLLGPSTFFALPNDIPGWNCVHSLSILGGLPGNALLSRTRKRNVVTALCYRCLPTFCWGKWTSQQWMQYFVLKVWCRGPAGIRNYSPGGQGLWQLIPHGRVEKVHDRFPRGDLSR